MTKQELIKAYQKSLKKIEEEQSHCEEQGELFLVGQYNTYIKLLRMFIKDLEKLDQPKVVSISNDLRNSFYTWQTRQLIISQGERMTPQELTLWAFALLLLAVATACTIVVGYVTFKILCAIKEKGLQAIVDWFVNS